MSRDRSVLSSGARGPLNNPPNPEFHEQTNLCQISSDNPGRKEPTTGEINYLNIFKHMYSKGFDGIVGMEHGISRPGKEGEMRLIEAYREVDAFDV